MDFFFKIGIAYYQVANKNFQTQEGPALPLPVGGSHIYQNDYL